MKVWPRRCGIVLSVLAPACRSDPAKSGPPAIDARDSASDVTQVDARDAARERPPDGLPSSDATADGWFGDSSLWSPVPGGESCGLYAAKGALPLFPRRSWIPCGVGCQVAAATSLSSDVGVERASASAAYQNGEVLLRLVSGSPSYGLVNLARLSDGQTLAAVQQRTALDRCVVAGNSPGSPHLVPFVGSSTGFGMFVGVFDTPRAALIWPSKWLAWQGVPTSLFSND